MYLPRRLNSDSSQNDLEMDYQYQPRIKAFLTPVLVIGPR